MKVQTVVFLGFLCTPLNPGQGINRRPEQSRVYKRPSLFPVVILSEVEGRPCPNPPGSMMVRQYLTGVPDQSLAKSKEAKISPKGIGKYNVY